MVARDGVRDPTRPAARRPSPEALRHPLLVAEGLAVVIGYRKEKS